jgi:FkbM family methyltransferase
VLDVGCFDGTDAIRYASNGGHRVYAFEPTRSKLKGIRERLRTAGLTQNVTLFNMALSNYTGTTTFWVSLAGSQVDQLSKPKWGGATPVEVRVDTLDNVVGPTEHVLYAKIDAQGHDPEVLYGATQLLASRRLRTLSFEVWPGGSDVDSYVRVTAWLERLGYRCYDCKRPHVKDAVNNAWPVHTVVRNLSEAAFSHLGAKTGLWTNFVCLVAPAGEA